MLRAVGAGAAMHATTTAKETNGGGTLSLLKVWLAIETRQFVTSSIEIIEDSVKYDQLSLEFSAGPHSPNGRPEKLCNNAAMCSVRTMGSKYFKQRHHKLTTRVTLYRLLKLELTLDRALLFGALRIGNMNLDEVVDLLRLLDVLLRRPSVDQGVGDIRSHLDFVLVHVLNPLVHTARRYYRLNGLVRPPDRPVQTWSFRGSKSRNKVSVGEPAEGSLKVISTPMVSLGDTVVTDEDFDESLVEGGIRAKTTGVDEVVELLDGGLNVVEHTTTGKIYQDDTEGPHIIRGGRVAICCS
jgi:hypothetical protein